MKWGVILYLLACVSEATAAPEEHLNNWEHLTTEFPKSFSNFIAASTRTTPPYTPRFCCNNGLVWLAGSRRCDGHPECPPNEAMGEPGGEDEDYCDATERKDWCDDMVKYPDNTALGVNGRFSIALSSLLTIVVISTTLCLGMMIGVWWMGLAKKIITRIFRRKHQEAQTEIAVEEKTTCSTSFLEQCFDPEQCILLSSSTTKKGEWNNYRGVKEQLRDACLEKNNRVLVISGSHGQIGKDTKGQALEHNGFTGFTKSNLLDYQLYRKDCETVGVAPRSKCNKQKPVGEAQEKAVTAKPECLMNDKSFDQIKFNVLNIAEFHREEEGDAEGLMKFICDFRPTVLMISWCFSTSCDLAMMLRRKGIFGTMFATFDMRVITGNPKAELSDEQRKVLEYKKYSREMKDVVLAGPHRSGKTILLCELAKAAMAEEGWETSQVRIYNRAGGKTILENLGEMLKPQHRDVKVEDVCELDEFPEESHVLMKMGSKMEEKEARLIVVGDNLTQLDEALINDLKGFANTKFLLAMSSNDNPIWQVLPESSSLQPVFHLRQMDIPLHNTKQTLAMAGLEGNTEVKELGNIVGSPSTNTNPVYTGPAQLIDGVKGKEFFYNNKDNEDKLASVVEAACINWLWRRRRRSWEKEERLLCLDQNDIRGWEASHLLIVSLSEYGLENLVMRTVGYCCIVKQK